MILTKGCVFDWLGHRGRVTEVGSTGDDPIATIVWDTPIGSTTQSHWLCDTDQLAGTFTPVTQKNIDLYRSKPVGTVFLDKWCKETVFTKVSDEEGRYANSGRVTSILGLFILDSTKNLTILWEPK